MATPVRREDYFDAAIEILSTDDHGGLKQAPLCRHLSVTTGSFYNYFESCDTEVRTVQKVVDDQRFEVVREAVTGLLGTDSDAENFARMGLFILYGYQQTLPQPALEHLRWALNRTFTDALAARTAV